MGTFVELCYGWKLLVFGISPCLNTRHTCAICLDLLFFTALTSADLTKTIVAASHVHDWIRHKDCISKERYMTSWDESGLVWPGSVCAV